MKNCLAAIHKGSYKGKVLTGQVWEVKVLVSFMSLFKYVDEKRYKYISQTKRNTCIIYYLIVYETSVLKILGTWLL